MKPALFALLFLTAFGRDDEKDQLREALGDRALVGPWIYDDLDAGIAEAKKTGKPMMVVIRCVP